MTHIQVNTKKTLMVGIMAVLAVSFAIPAVAAFPYPGAGVTVMTTKHSYTGAATITIVGIAIPAPPKGTVATITINGPTPGPAVAMVASPTIHGAFYAQVTAGGVAWTCTGTYTVTATVGEMSGTTTFSYTGARTCPGS
jgi:hypothetical protein